LEGNALEQVLCNRELDIKGSATTITHQSMIATTIPIVKSRTSTTSSTVTINYTYPLRSPLINEQPHIKHVPLIYCSTIFLAPPPPQL
jgi:hypothetical protein